MPARYRYGWLWYLVTFGGAAIIAAASHQH